MEKNDYPHMCRDGHDQIGWSGDEELCPVCRVQGALEEAQEHERQAMDSVGRLGGTIRRLDLDLAHTEALLIKAGRKTVMALEGSAKHRARAWRAERERDEARAEANRVIRQLQDERRDLAVAHDERAEALRERDDAQARRGIEVRPLKSEEVLLLRQRVDSLIATLKQTEDEATENERGHNEAVGALRQRVAALERERDEARESARKAAHDWQETVRDQSGRLAKAERERDANFAAYEQEKRERLAERAELWKEQETLRQRVAALEDALREAVGVFDKPGVATQPGYLAGFATHAKVISWRAALAQKDEPRG